MCIMGATPKGGGGGGGGVGEGMAPVWATSLVSPGCRCGDHVSDIERPKAFQHSSAITPVAVSTLDSIRWLREDGDT